METRLLLTAIAAAALVACDSPQAATHPATTDTAAPARRPVRGPEITSAEINDVAQRLATDIVSSPRFVRFRQDQERLGSKDLVARLSRTEVRGHEWPTAAEAERIVIELEYALTGAMASHGIVFQAERDPPRVAETADCNPEPGARPAEPIPSGTALKSVMMVDLVLYVEESVDPPAWAARVKLWDGTSGTLIVTASASSRPTPR